MLNSRNIILASIFSITALQASSSTHPQEDEVAKGGCWAWFKNCLSCVKETADSADKLTKAANIVVQDANLIAQASGSNKLQHVADVSNQVTNTVSVTSTVLQRTTDTTERDVKAIVGSKDPISALTATSQLLQDTNASANSVGIRLKPLDDLASATKPNAQEIAAVQKIANDLNALKSTATTTASDVSSATQAVVKPNPSTQSDKK